MICIQNQWVIAKENFRKKSTKGQCLAPNATETQYTIKYGSPGAEAMKILSIIVSLLDVVITGGLMGLIVEGRGVSLLCENTIENIQKIVCKYLITDLKVLKSRSRKEEVCHARSIAIYLCRKYTDESLQSIGDHFNRNHPAILYSYEKVKRRIEVDEDLRNEVNFIVNRITERNDWIKGRSKMDEETFGWWGIIEVFGHNTIAGYISQGPLELIRVDVPAVNNQKKFTKFYGPKAIYGITPTTEDIAIRAAMKLSVRPVSLWVVPGKALPELAGHLVDAEFQDGENKEGPF